MPKKKPETEETKKSKLISLPEPKDKTRDKLVSELAIAGLCNNAGIIANFGADTLGELNLMDCIATLKERATEINGGNLKKLETLLAAQAYALDSVFSSMIARARLNIGHYPDTVNKYMGLALRAQSQCRSTVEAIAEIQNPRPYIQNNRAEYQQVNNGVQPRKEHDLYVPPARAEENSKSTNELLEDKRNESEWLDTGKTEETGRADPELETVGAKHGT